jgi:hypothetical protein
MIGSSGVRARAGLQTFGKTVSDCTGDLFILERDLAPASYFLSSYEPPD